jgi:hypothetical protein
VGRQGGKRRERESMRMLRYQRLDDVILSENCNEILSTYIQERMRQMPLKSLQRQVEFRCRRLSARLWDGFKLLVKEDLSY